MKTIVDRVAFIYATVPENLTAVVKESHKGNDAFKIAMYLGQELADEKLRDIAEFFNLSHIDSVSFITH